jgi:hypothetical protein
MEKTIFIRLLAALTPIEFREFARYVNSPFHNRRKEVERFFSVIKKYYPDFKGENFTAEKIFSRLYPAKKFDISVIRRLTSFCLKLLETYLAYSGLKNEQFYFDLSLAIQYSAKGMYKSAYNKTLIADKKYRDMKGDYEFYFWKKFLIERQKNSLHGYTGDDHLASESIINRTNYFSYHMFVNICKSLVSLCINEKNFNSDYSKSDFFLFIKNLQLENYFNSLSKQTNEYYPVLAAEYFQAMTLLNPENNAYFKSFKNILKKELTHFTYIEQLNFYTVFEAVCTLRIESGHKEYSMELFEAYKDMIAKGLYSYSEGGEFILRIFRNIVHTAVMVKQYTWLEQFLKCYLQKLPDDSRYSMGNMAEAILFFEKGEFEKSLSSLSKLKYELFHFKIDFRNLQLKIFYELEYFKELEAAIDAYKHFIANNRYISQRYKTICTGFVKSVNKILKIKMNELAVEPLILKNEILSAQGAMYQSWLLEKVSELKP